MNEPRSAGDATWALLAAILIAVLFAWNSADGEGYDHTVQCIAPATNCG